MATVLAMMGLPGSGKTTLARLLVAKKGLAFISRDEIRDAMFKPCTYTADEKQAAYRAVIIALETNLRLNRSSVIDGMTFSRSEEINEVHQVCQQVNAKVLFVYLDIPVRLAQDRVRRDLKREDHNGPADRTSQLVKEVAGRFDELPDFAIRFDGTKSPEQLLEEVRTYMEG